VDAPDPNVPLFFEAASVKPSDPKAGPGAGIRRQPGGRFNTFNSPVRLLITFAYQIQGYQLVAGPDWIGNTRYDIVAKMEGDPPSVRPGTGADHMMLATRTLLGERFKLKVIAKPASSISTLDDGLPTASRAGPKTASGDCSPEAFRRAVRAPGARRGSVCGIQGPAASGSRYPLIFARPFEPGGRVVDRTGLTGTWTSR
jgi:hypothetical protein